MWGEENLSDVTFMPLCESRADAGSLAGTDKTYISSPSAASGTGQRDVPDTGLMDYKARMYSPWLGRFIQPDAIVPGAGNSQAWNRFSYTLNNPVNYTDPSGHKACIDWDDNGQCVEDPDWHGKNNPSPDNPHKKKKKPQLVFMRGLDEKDFLNAWQSQGDTPYCGPYSLAIVGTLLTNQCVTGNYMNEFMVYNRQKSSGYGVTGIGMMKSANYYFDGYIFNYSSGNTIETLTYNVDIGRITIVGVSWQTNKSIMSTIAKNAFTKPAHKLFEGVTVGHWLVLAGYDSKEQILIFADPGNPKSITKYPYKVFNQYWNGQPNSFIGFGEMITVDR